MATQYRARLDMEGTVNKSLHNTIVWDKILTQWRVIWAGEVQAKVFSEQEEAESELARLFKIMRRQPFKRASE